MLALGGTFGATGSSIPVTSNPPDWSGVQQLRGFGPSARAGLGLQRGGWTVGPLVSAWWVPRPTDLRDGVPAASGNARLGGGMAGAFGDYAFGPGLFAGVDLGVSGLRFRPADNFATYTRAGFGFGVRAGWQDDRTGLGVEVGTTGHTASDTGPVGTFWSGGELGVRLRWSR